MEGIAIKYYNQLNDNREKNGGLILSRMCGDLFGTRHDGTSIKMFNKLVNIYGRMIVYFSLLDLIDVKNLDTSKTLYPIINYLAKKRLEEMSKESTTYIDLNKVSEEIGKEIRRRKKEIKRDS